MRFPLRREKNFRLFVDSGSGNEPQDRWFGALPAALRAFDALDDRWKPYAWIIEYHDQHVIGGIPTVRNIVHMKHGRRVEG
jgi:hypothetical protein